MTSFGRAAYRDIHLYEPGRKPCAVDLSDNTNLFGIPPSAERAIREVSAALVTRYPSVYANELKAALAAYAGVDAASIVTGCGSDDILDSAMRAFAEPGDVLAFSDPTFSPVPLFGQMNALRTAAAPIRGDFQLDPDALLAADPKVLYVCSPNNPTGVTVADDVIRYLLERANGVVILDEAYAEFSREPAGWLRRAPAERNLLVVRTLSKAFGLAGLRVGYAVGPPSLIAEVEKSRGPYKVGGLAERAAVTALTDDRIWVDARVAEVQQNRARFVDALGKLGLQTVPSDANFVLVRVADAKGVGNKMREAGVQVRPFTHMPAIGDGVRISIGPWEMMEKALGALRKAVP